MAVEARNVRLGGRHGAGGQQEHRYLLESLFVLRPKVVVVSLKGYGFVGTVPLLCSELASTLRALYVPEWQRLSDRTFYANGVSGPCKIAKEEMDTTTKSVLIVVKLNLRRLWFSYRLTLVEQPGTSFGGRLTTRDRSNTGRQLRVMRSLEAWIKTRHGGTQKPSCGRSAKLHQRKSQRWCKAN